MSIRVTEYTEEMIPAVREFNARMQSGGVNLRFYESCVPHGLAKAPGRKLYEEHFVAINDDGAIRGAYGLKHQDFWIGGKTVSIADFWLPISEGAVNKTYAPVATALVFDAQRRQPLLYGLGMGGYDEAVVRLLVASRWRILSVPFFFRIVHPNAFLHNITYLRRSRLQAATLDVLALTGLGWIAVKTLQWVCCPKAVQHPAIAVEEVAEFSDWADSVWDARKRSFGLSAVRDAATLRILYPREESRFIRIKVMREKNCIGWAVLLDTKLSGHKQCGRMRLGSLVDCLALPTEIQAVAIAARDALEKRGVDLIVSNQSHAAWGSALKAAGFLGGPSNFLLATSPRLTDMLKALNVQDADIHFNRGDGDGPNNL